MSEDVGLNNAIARRERINALIRKSLEHIKVRRNRSPICTATGLCRISIYPGATVRTHHH